MQNRVILKSFFSLFLMSSLAPGTAVSLPRHFPEGTHEVTLTPTKGIRTDLLKNITSLVEKSIHDGNYPGAVVLASHRGKIIYKGVFGNQQIIPTIVPMHFNTLFDLASLTKVIATAPAIMQLFENGKLELDTPAAYYWPALKNHGKEKITIRELLTHTSGLISDITLTEQSESAVLQKIQSLMPQHPPGTFFRYSDINFIILAHLVEIISQERFDQYVKNHLFKPLGMDHTLFLPPKTLQKRIAPTQLIHNKLRWGEVNDPTAYAMGGVAGNAGLFSTAHDLAIFSQCLLDGGRIPSSKQHSKTKAQYILGPLTLLKMQTPQTAKTVMTERGLGWDIDSELSNRGVLFSKHAFGHTGWTGTSLLIDPSTETWLIILTSRTHPLPLNKNQLVQDRRIIANLLAASITDNISRHSKNTSAGELLRAYKN